ncbi:MAG: pilus assembly protein N-terminal domain-containing protein [Acidobacteria bacterium]|nr:pilus assembly protein N-terminal domain-containing protein [Acidobacteriota bacterium]
MREPSMLIQRRLLAALAVLATLPVLTQAQTALPRELALVVGRGELLQFNADIVRVAVSEPRIADAVVVSPREVMVNGKGVGKATIVVWETGSIPMRYQIDVKEDRSTFDGVKLEIAKSLGDSGITITGNTETVVLTGSVKDADAAKRAEALASTHARKVVNLLEVPHIDPRQILLQVKFASVDRVGLNELGFNYFSRNDKTLGSLTTQQFQAPRFSQLQFQDQEFANSTLNFADLLNLFVFRPDLNIGATIKALQSQNLLQILAEPNLIVIEGKEASFLAGGQFPFPTIQATTTGGSVSPVVTVRFQPFGVQLGFTPTVTPSGAIHLKVTPEVSSLDFSNAVTLQGFLIPAISTRRAETEVILKDGESFAIAGLIDNRVVQTLSRVRGLGDIPIIGNLFRSRSTRKATDELLVVITPRFVKPVPAGEPVKLPDTVEAFLPTVAEQNAAKDAKKKKKDKTTQPEFVGPRGHTQPQPDSPKP